MIMKRHETRRAAGVAVVFVAVLAGLAGAQAHAANPTAAVIQESSVFVGEHQPPVGTFVASGLAGCSSGSFADAVVSFSPSGARIVLDRTYACDGGGSVTARVALHLGTIDAAGQQAADGTWRITSADGPLTGLQGSGTATGVNSACAPVGVILGTCATGVGTVTASVH
jgi:hypothetical protein